MQTKIESLVEASINIVIGYVLAIGTQYIVFPLMGIMVSFGEHLVIGCVFLSVSLLKAYLIRRWFNARLIRKLRREQ